MVYNVSPGTVAPKMNEFLFIWRMCLSPVHAHRMGT
jgi:hypothetical protein